MKKSLLSVARLACSGIIIQALSDGVNASAQIVNLTSSNSSAAIDLSSPAGMSGWLVDGVNVMNQQSFLFRTDSGDAVPISSLGAPSISQQIANSLTAIYAGPQFTMTTVYSLFGGDPERGTADMLVQVKIQNTSLTPLNLVFFQFVDFPVHANIELGRNARGLIGEAVNLEGGPGLNDVVYNVDDDIFFRANEGMVGDATAVMDDLLTVPGFMPAGPDDGTGAMALGWDQTLGTNQTLILGENFNVSGVPEPSAIRIGVAGLVLAGLVRIHMGRRRKGSECPNLSCD